MVTREEPPEPESLQKAKFNMVWKLGYKRMELVVCANIQLCACLICA